MSYFMRQDEIPAKTLPNGAVARVVSGEKLQFSIVRIEPGSVVAEHSHPHEQAGMVLEGEFDLDVGGERRTLRAGDLYLIPGGVKHAAYGLGAPAVTLDVFSPPREEYR